MPSLGQQQCSLRQHQHCVLIVPFVQDRSKVQGAKQRLFDRYHNGTIKALIDKKAFHGVEAVPDAVEYMLTGQAIGKVVVDLS